MSHHRYNLFEVIGLELEYMIVAAETLEVAPICDRILADQAGEPTTELTCDSVGWSNELALHVIEIKTPEPVADLSGQAGRFDAAIRRINDLCAARAARLMPTAMHPWMDPATQTRLWDQANGPIYQAFDRIFDCRGHGWSNLQSLHINLPFGDDEQFGRLHAAIRVLLPLLPALAASSPVVDGRVTGLCDNRLAAYAVNCARLPLVTGHVVPEAVFSVDQYHREILQPMYRQIAPLDADGILQEEWLNARGAIARFDRGSIEIRVLDVQEAPAADVAIAGLVVGALRLLVDEVYGSYSSQRSVRTETLAGVYASAVAEADRATLADPQLLSLLGAAKAAQTLRDIWQDLAEQVALRYPQCLPGELVGPIETILSAGPLARRIVGQLGDKPVRAELRGVYARLCDALASGKMYRPQPAGELPGPVGRSGE